MLKKKNAGGLKYAGSCWMQSPEPHFLTVTVFLVVCKLLKQHDLQTSCSASDTGGAGDGTTDSLAPQGLLHDVESQLFMTTLQQCTR
eukprot:6467056-Amphidinium_carterae.1